jgi:hypothetical protein
MGKNVIEMLLERKQCFEKRCKGTYYFANFQIILDFFRNFVAEKRKSDGN